MNISRLMKGNDFSLCHWIEHPLPGKTHDVPGSWRSPRSVLPEPSNPLKVYQIFGLYLMKSSQLIMLCSSGFCVLILTMIRISLIQEYKCAHTENPSVLRQNIPAKIPNSCPCIAVKIPVIVPCYIYFYQDRVDCQHI